MSNEEFQISEKVLGKGAFGTVYLGTHVPSGQEVAIKQVPKEKADFGVLSREIGIMKRCDHENIIKFYGCYEDENYVYIATEYARGGELFNHIVKRRRYSEADTRAMVKQILSALCYLHQNHVAHLDLKPENLLLKAVPENYDDMEERFIPCIKLADFGTSVIFGEGQERLASIGTPGYVAPEVLQQKTYTTEPDVYALGVITYVLIAGHLPFSDGDTKEMLRAQVRGQWTFTRRFDQVSDEAKDFIRLAMTTDYKKRPTSAQLLKHPWMSEVVIDHDLLESAEDLRKYIARLRLRAGVQTLAVAMRISHIQDFIKDLD